MTPHAAAPDTPERLLYNIASTMPERIAPGCRHFGACGGCQLQDLPQQLQLDAKGNMLTTLLQQAGMRDLPALHIHAAEPWRYRNRARMRVEEGAIGYSRRGSNDFLPIDECPIVSPLLWRAASALREAVEGKNARWPLRTRSIELFANGDESALQLSIHVDATVATVDRDAPRDLRLLCDAVASGVPQLAGAGLLASAAPDPSTTRRVQKSASVEIARWGQPALLYRVDGTEYRVTRNAFFQVNRFLTATMRQLVTAGRSGRLAWDLFAGAGLFSVPLAGCFDEVVAVEVGEPAATDLAAHLRACGPGHRAVRSTALRFLQQHSGGRAPNLVVLDPPRAGLGPQAARALAASGADEIVYVSCEVGSFAADSRALLQSGYTLHTLHLLDLFPQTFHTETVATFRR